MALASLLSMIESENAILKGETLSEELLDNMRNLRSDPFYAYDINRILIVNTENAQTINPDMENDLIEAERYFGTTLVEQELVIGKSQVKVLREIRDLDQSDKKDEAQARRLQYEQEDPFIRESDGSFKEDAEGNKVKKSEWAALAAPSPMLIGNHIKIYEARLRAIDEYANRAAEAGKIRRVKNIDLSTLGEMEALGELALEVIKERFDEIAELKAPGSEKFIVKGISYIGKGAYKKVFKVTVETDTGEIVFGIRPIQPVAESDMDVSVEGTVREVKIFQETDKLDGVAVNIDKVYVHKAQFKEEDQNLSSVISDSLSERLSDMGVHAVTVGDFVEGTPLDLIEDEVAKKAAYADAVKTVMRTWLLSMEKEEQDFLEEDEREYVGYAIQDMKGANFVRADKPETQTIQKRLEKVVSIDFGQAQRTYLHMLIGYIKTDLAKEIGLHTEVDRDWTKEAIDFTYQNILAAIDDFVSREGNTERHKGRIEEIKQIRGKVEQRYISSLKRIGVEYQPATTEADQSPVTTTKVDGNDGIVSEAPDTAVDQDGKITDHTARNLTLGQRMVNDEVIGVDSQGNAVRYSLSETQRKAGHKAEETPVTLESGLASKVSTVYGKIGSVLVQAREGVLASELAKHLSDEYLDKNGLRYTDEELADLGLTEKDRYKPLQTLLETIQKSGLRIIKDSYFIDEFGEFKVIAHSAQKARYGGKRTWLTEMELRLLSEAELVSIIIEEGLHLQNPEAFHGEAHEKEKGKIYHNSAFLESVAKKMNDARKAFRSMMKSKGHKAFSYTLAPDVFDAADKLALQMKELIRESGLSEDNKKVLTEAAISGQIQGPTVLQERIIAVQLAEKLSKASFAGDEIAINEIFVADLLNSDYSVNTLRSFYLEVLSMDEATSVSILNSVRGLQDMYHAGQIQKDVLIKALSKKLEAVSDLERASGLTPLARFGVSERIEKAIQDMASAEEAKATVGERRKGESKDAGVLLGGGSVEGKPDAGKMKLLGKAHIGGEKDKEFWVDESGNLWIFKKNPYVNQAYRPLCAELFYRFARRYFGSSIEVYEMTLNGHRGSIERVVFNADTSGIDWTSLSETEINKQFRELAAPNVKKLVNQGAIDLFNLPKAQQKAVLREMVIDWLFSNNDAHPANFIMGSDGLPVGIDKEQVFKYFGKDKLDLSYLPNGMQFAPLSYLILVNLAMQGGLSIELIEEVLAEIESISDAELVELIRPFAQEYAASHPDMTEESFIRLFLSRKGSLRKDFMDFFDKINAAHGLNNGITELKLPPVISKIDISKINFPDITFDPIRIPELKINIGKKSSVADGDVQYNSQPEMQRDLAGMYGVDGATASRMQDAARDPEAMVALVEEEFNRLIIGQSPSEIERLNAKKREIIRKIRNPGPSEQSLKAVLRLLAAWIGRVSQQMGDHHRVYLARDGGYFNLTDEQLRKLEDDKEYEGGSSVYHLSRASMSGEGNWHVYKKMRYEIFTEAKKASKGDINVFYSEMRRLFREAYESDENFKKIVDAVKAELTELGYDKQKKLAFVDTGFAGTNPMFLKMVLEMDRSPEELVDEAGEQRIKVAIIQPSSIEKFAQELFGFDLEALDETQRLLVQGIAQQFADGKAVGGPLEALIHPIGFNAETWEMERTQPSTQLEVFYQKMITVQMAHAHHQRVTGVGDDPAAMLEMITKDFGIYLTDFSTDYIPPKSVSEAFKFEMPDYSIPDFEMPDYEMPKYEALKYEKIELKKIDLSETLQEMFNKLRLLSRIEMLIISFLPKFLHPFVRKLFSALKGVADVIASRFINPVKSLIHWFSKDARLLRKTIKMINIQQSIINIETQHLGDTRDLLRQVTENIAQIDWDKIRINPELLRQKELPDLRELDPNDREVPSLDLGFSLIYDYWAQMKKTLLGKYKDILDEMGITEEQIEEMTNDQIMQLFYEIVSQDLRNNVDAIWEENKASIGRIDEQMSRMLQDHMKNLFAPSEHLLSDEQTEALKAAVQKYGKDEKAPRTDGIKGKLRKLAKWAGNILKKKPSSKDDGDFNNLAVTLDGKIAGEEGINNNDVGSQLEDFYANNQTGDIRTITLSSGEEVSIDLRGVEDADALVSNLENFLNADENADIRKAIAGTTIAVLGGRISVAETEKGISYFHYGHTRNQVYVGENLLKALLAQNRDGLAAAFRVEMTRKQLGSEGRGSTLDIVNGLSSRDKISLTGLLDTIADVEARAIVSSLSPESITEQIRNAASLIDGKSASGQVDMVLLGKLKGPILEKVIKLLSADDVEKVSGEVKKIEAERKAGVEEQAQAVADNVAQTIANEGIETETELNSVGFGLMMEEQKLLLRAKDAVDISVDSTTADMSLQMVMEMMSKAGGADFVIMETQGKTTEEVKEMVKKAFTAFSGMSKSLEEGEVLEVDGILFEHTKTKDQFGMPIGIIRVSEGTVDNKADWGKLEARVTEESRKAFGYLEESLDIKGVPVYVGKGMVAEMSPEEQGRFLNRHKNVITMETEAVDALVKQGVISGSVGDDIKNNWTDFELADKNNRMAVLGEKEELPEEAGDAGILRVGKVQADDMTGLVTKLAVRIADVGRNTAAKSDSEANKYLREILQAMFDEDDKGAELVNAMFKQAEEEGKSLLEVILNSGGMFPPVSVKIKDMESFMRAQQVIDTMA
ncbi:MAG: hypothetical protein P9M03_11440 [Candidatus Theseobacter exili]|nr:hypothetical protein [Candidatus Theseobacter exili]